MTTIGRNRPPALIKVPENTGFTASRGERAERFWTKIPWHGPSWQLERTKKRRFPSSWCQKQAGFLKTGAASSIKT